MTLFFWNSSLETGNVRIDQQHRRLFALTNELADVVRDVGATYDVDRLVAELRDYAASHFCDEETVMACSSLSSVEQRRHRCAHRLTILAHGRDHRSQVITGRQLDNEE